MRITIMAAIAAASLVPGLALANGHTERARASDMRAHSGRAAHAGTTWNAPTGGMREEYRRDVPLYGDEDHADDRDDYYGDTGTYGVEDYAMSDRFVRDDDGNLDYDRDYPYDYPYGQSGGYYTIVETTTTTGPSVVTYVEKEVAVHRPMRTRKMSRAYRATGSKIIRRR